LLADLHLLLCTTFCLLFSEMFTPYWRTDPLTVAEMQVQAATEMFSNDASVALTQLHKVWPKYQHDNYTGRIAALTDDFPLIALSGTLDQATLYSWAVNYTRTVNKTLLTFPQAPHATALGNTPVKTHGALDCAQQIVIGFFVSGGQHVNRTCIDDLQQLDLGGLEEATKRQAMARFGTTSLWGSD
jgi:hypothetical protein